MTDETAHEIRRKAKANLIKAESESTIIANQYSTRDLEKARADYDIAILKTETEKQKKIIEVCAAIDENIKKLKSLMSE